MARDVTRNNADTMAPSKQRTDVTVEDFGAIKTMYNLPACNAGMLFIAVRYFDASWHNRGLFEGPQPLGTIGQCCSK